jgi:hypothetical protein
MEASHHATPTGFDDMFVVKYDEKAQKDLVKHFDGGQVSFMLALSSRSDYEGGGTKFDCMENVVHLERGELILFDADLYHQGVPISQGTRYLLVGFCFTGNAPLKIGHLKLSLRVVTKEEEEKKKRKKMEKKKKEKKKKEKKKKEKNKRETMTTKAKEKQSTKRGAPEDERNVEVGSGKRTKNCH